MISQIEYLHDIFDDVWYWWERNPPLWKCQLFMLCLVSRMKFLVPFRPLMPIIVNLFDQWKKIMKLTYMKKSWSKLIPNIMSLKVCEYSNLVVHVSRGWRLTLRCEFACSKAKRRNWLGPIPPLLAIRVRGQLRLTISKLNLSSIETKWSWTGPCSVDLITTRPSSA